MGEIEAQWRSLQDEYGRASKNGSKDEYVELEKKVDGLLRAHFSKGDLRQLAGTIVAAPTGGFPTRVVEYMARTFIDSGDRDSLVRLLSGRCPGRVAANDAIEYHLAFRGRKLKDPLLVLGEAYARSESPENRRVIAAAVRRGFADVGLGRNDDSEFVKRAMEWYQREKPTLSANPNYVRNERFVPIEAYEINPGLYEQFPPDIKREPLFHKADRRQNPSTQQAEAGNIASDSKTTIVSEALSKDESDGELDLARLEGSWRAIDATEDGQPLAPEKRRKLRFVFKKGTLSINGLGPDPGAMYLVQLGPPHKPRAMDLRLTTRAVDTTKTERPTGDDSPDERCAAIVELKGETLRLCFSSPVTREKPTSFRAEEGSGETSFVLKRVKE